jgi:hypothetical protein
MAKEKILKFPTADPSNVAQRAFLPNKADKKALEKEAKRDAKKRDGKYKKETQMMRKKKKKMNLMEQVVQEQRRLRSYQQKR